MTRDIKHEKYVQAINYFARKSTDNSINRLKLMKLIWLADRLHLLRHGKTTLDVHYVAMPHGPVPSEVYDVAMYPYSEYAEQYIVKSGWHAESKAEVDLTHFAKTELNAFDEIWELFGHMDRYELRDLSHKYPEWLRHGSLVEKSRTSRPIDMDDFFELPADKKTKGFELFDMDEDQLEYAKCLYDDYVEQQKVLQALKDQDEYLDQLQCMN